MDFLKNLKEYNPYNVNAQNILRNLNKNIRSNSDLKVENVMKVNIAGAFLLR